MKWLYTHQYLSIMWKHTTLQEILSKHIHCCYIKYCFLKEIHFSIFQNINFFFSFRFSYLFRYNNIISPYQYLIRMTSGKFQLSQRLESSFILIYLPKILDSNFRWILTLTNIYWSFIICFNWFECLFCFFIDIFFVYTFTLLQIIPFIFLICIS